MRTRAVWLLLMLLLALPVGVRGAPAVAAAGQCFAETGYCIQGRFLEYWTAHGGLAINGYPLSDEFTQTLEDGKPYTVQYFERARFEYHPENQPPYDVELGQFGRRILAAQPAPAGCGPFPAGPAGDLLALYRDPQGRFTAQAPADWPTRREADGNVSLVAPNGAGVTLAIADAPGRTLDEYTSQILQQVQQPAAANGRFELLCQDRVQVGPVPASRLRFVHNRVDTADGHPVPEEIDRIIALSNGRALNAVGFMVPGDQGDLDTIEHIAASVVFGP